VSNLILLPLFGIGVVDIGGKIFLRIGDLATGINDPGGKFAASVNDTGVPAVACLPVVAVFEQTEHQKMQKLYVCGRRLTLKKTNFFKSQTLNKKKTLLERILITRG
jgi:hypothetical protein